MSFINSTRKRKAELISVQLEQWKARKTMGKS